MKDLKISTPFLTKLYIHWTFSSSILTSTTWNCFIKRGIRWAKGHKHFFVIIHIPLLPMSNCALPSTENTLGTCPLLHPVVSGNLSSKEQVLGAPLQAFSFFLPRTINDKSIVRNESQYSSDSPCLDHMWSYHAHCGNEKAAYSHGDNVLCSTRYWLAEQGQEFSPHCWTIWLRMSNSYFPRVRQNSGCQHLSPGTYDMI